jgi:hypothetical protein
MKTNIIRIDNPIKYFSFNSLIIGAKGRASSELKSSVYRENLISEEEDFDKRSLFGTPVYSNLEIPAGQYTDLNGNVINYEGVRIDTILFDISQERNIIRTAVAGKNGTIKQFIADGDYIINCSGIITGESFETNSGFGVESVVGVPEAELRKLKAICSVPKEIEVISEFLDFFDITTVVITSPTFSEKEGSRNEIFFACSMISDEPIELK